MTGSRQDQGHVRLRRDRQGDRIRRRRCRRDPAAVAGAQAAAGRRAHAQRSTRRWSGRCSRCWRAWSGAASRSTARCCRGCPANSRRKRRASKPRSRSSPASRSMSAGPSRSATSCSASWDCRAAPRPRPANGRPARALLEELAEQGHELPQKILDWRQVSKLKSTYTDALPTYVNPTTHRVHTTYALAATTTGRLSSSEPNLQNIPVRTEDGRKIRRAFIADARPQAGVGRLFADRAAAARRDRRHPAAAQGVPRRPRHPRHDGVGNVRRAGQGHAGARCAAAPRRSISASSTASRRSALPTSSASRARKPAPISRNISSAFPASATTWTRPRRSAKKHGYVETLFGRKCHYPDINASNASIRAFNERAAINARLQGTAADIIRRAMIRMEAALAKKKLSAQMLLQVHDELIFEVPDAEVEKTLPVVTARDGGRAAAGAVALGAAAGRRPRRRQLGRGALTVW